MWKQKVARAKAARKKQQHQPQQSHSRPTPQSIGHHESSDSEDDSSGDDEGSSEYTRGGYHPVRIGDVYNKRYVVQKKLGWGHFSTVWLATDTSVSVDHPHRLVALKIQKSAEHYTEAAEDEIELLSQIHGKSARKNGNTSTQGSEFIVSLLDDFVVFGPNGRHVCLVFEVLGHNLLWLIRKYDHQGIPIALCKQLSRQMLSGLDYIHSKCEIIHTDIKPENFLLDVMDPLDPKDFPADVKPVAVGVERRKRRRRGQMTAAATSSPAEAGEPTQDPTESLALVREQLTSGLIDGHKVTKNQRKRLKLKQKKLQEMIEAQAAGGDSGQATAAATIMEDSGSALDEDVGQAVSNSEPAAALPEEEQVAAPEQLQKMQRQKQEQPDSAAAADAVKSWTPSVCKIADLGNACWTYKHFTSDIATRQYRGPEVIVGCDYDTTVDLWSTACLIFELVTGDYLFDPRKQDSDEDDARQFTRDEDHLSLMIELLGRMPKRLTSDGRFSRQFFDRNGNLRRISNVDPWPLVDVLRQKYKLPDSEAEPLADFLTGMLELEPARRKPASEMLKHPWLSTPPSIESVAEAKRIYREDKQELARLAALHLHDRSSDHDSEQGASGDDL